MKSLVIICLLVVIYSIGNASSIIDYQFVSPKPGSEFNTRETSIIICEGSDIDPSSLQNPDRLVVVGSKTGLVTGQLILSSNHKTIIFKPDKKFEPDEMVRVNVNAGIKTTSGIELSPYEFSFKIAPFFETPNPYAVIEELKPNYHQAKKVLQKSVTDTIPTNFPPMHIDIYDTTAIGDGYLFMAVASDVEGVGYYLVMLNNDGTPFYAKELKHDYAYDFKKQPNGKLTYAQFLEHHSYTGGGNVIHMIMDNSFSIVDSVQMGNGYIAEAHDFQILPNGHYLLFGYYLTQVDMSQYVDGGYPAAMVSGGVVQELDAEKHVVFQWRSWDYYDFSEYSWGRRSKGETVSAFHLNTISQDIDGHILLASPGQNWKINRQTGEIMWKLGGNENEFSIVGVDSSDAVGYLTGHTFHRITNGNVLIHDNGNRRGTRTSKVHEFRIDEENKIAEWIWSYVPDVIIPGWHRGSAQRLPNGNTVIGWGGSSGKPSPACTEVNTAGEKIFELSFVPPDIESYRAFRFPFTGGEPGAEVTIIEVAPGNSYNFSEGDTNDTGIQIKINAINGSGYNELTVKKYKYAPQSPQFIGKAPMVIPSRMVLSNYALTAIDADVYFDVEKWNISDPANTVIYHREFEGNGLFDTLSTTYNHVTNQLIATTNKFGEMILAKSDVASLVFAPMGYEPKDSSTVNQTIPLTLRWNPIGYVMEYSVQVAKDTNFNELIVNEEFLTEAHVLMETLDANTSYYWRVKSMNDAGESEWSPTYTFTATAPLITVQVPNGGEEWQRGLPYFVFWQDNLADDVIVELIAGDQSISILDTVTSNGVFSWDIPVDIPTGVDYKIHIKSLDGTLADSSDNFFTVMDTSSTVVEKNLSLPHEYVLLQNYPNPFSASGTPLYGGKSGVGGSTTRIVFRLPKPGIVSIKVFNCIGEELTTLIHEQKNPGVHHVLFNGKDFPSGLYFYKMECNGFTSIRKMLLMK